MRWTEFFIPTLREVPGDAEIVSHKLMLRAGLIQKLASGLYFYLPLGLLVLEKVKAIIREELTKKKAIELMMPILQPRSIWEESGRYDKMGELMMKTFDRNNAEFILGPTHEEIITDLVRKRINSYKMVPKNFYQIQNKFRDEVRPRFGLMRAKEFIMKDGYSFDLDEQGLNKSYWDMYDAYTAIFNRCGLTVKTVEADTGVMGGNASHEFMALAASGEDTIIECSACEYAANAELALRFPQEIESAEDLQEMQEVSTPNLRKVDELVEFFKVPAARFIKTLIYETAQEKIAVLVRGDIEINENKLRKALQVAEVKLTDDKTIEVVTGGPLGFSGPVGLVGTRIIADTSIEKMKNSITGANKQDMHLQGVNLERDFQVEAFFDIGAAKAGDACPKCRSLLNETRGIEIGQVFKLGTKYAETLGATVLNENGKDQVLVMGCYGIGVSRTAQAVVEQCNDENGIVWPVAVAPFEVVVLPLNTNDEEIMNKANDIYETLKTQGVDVLLDDRHERAGVKFKDTDLIGFPVRVVIGKKTLEEGMVEISLRKDGKKELVPFNLVIDKVKSLLKA